MERLGPRDPEAEHQARLMGMALLLGELTPAALSTLGDEDLRKALMAKLPLETLVYLETQVGELEVFLKAGTQVPAPDLQHAKTRPRWPPLASLPGEEEEPPGAAGYFEPHLDLGHQILAKLTLPRWNQYTNLTFLGEGGMGRIFKAFDPTLRRQVALKFLRRVDPGRVSALMEEARNQARVNHPFICKVFEAKEWQGQSYVAMQFIDGQTLDKVAPDLTEKERLEVMEKVADAMHAAHREGLIHRDLKPANIMVERTPEGLYNPCILDFGLAHDLTMTSDTLDGTVMGTALYMAPEQARGDLAAIGRRTDIYALGVTLYELFAGAPPFHWAGPLECLRLVQEEKVPPLGSVVAAIHPDLQTIVMKCLEKEPSQRYDSALALAEDLRRYREGEPILARPSTFLYRTGKYVRKHRVFAVLGAAAFVAAGALGTLWLRARVTASNQAQWAGHFGQEAEQIEALVRYTRLEPRHPIREEMGLVRDRIRAMELEVLEAGGQATGPGNYALGRAYLALDEPELALQDLDRAWSAGYRIKDMSYARGKAMGSLYARGLLKARALQDPSLRQGRIQALEETLRDPAVALLRQGRGSTLEPGEFQEGLLAMYERHYAVALRAVGTTRRVAPWFYEARALEAEVELDLARKAPDASAAALHFRNAGLALEAATALAPSDPGLCDLEARHWREEMVQRRREGRSTRDAYEALLAACGRWRVIDPWGPGPGVGQVWGEIERAHGLKPAKRVEPLIRAIAMAETILRAYPDHPEALGALAAGLQLQAYAAMNAGQDPRAALTRATTLLRRALMGDSAPFELFDPYALALWARVEYEAIQGQDPSPVVAQALDTLSNLAQRYPKVADFEGFRGGIQVELAEFQASHKVDPEPVARRALANLDRAVRMAPARFDFPFSQGNAHLALAQYRVLNGLPAAEALLAAETSYQSAHHLNGASPMPLDGLAEVGLLRCEELEAQGRNPLAALAQAEAQIEGRDDSNWRTQLTRARVALLHARWAPEPGARPAFLATADQEASRALAQAGRIPAALVMVAQVQLAWAALEPRGAQGRRLLARRVLNECLKRDPGYQPAIQGLEAVAAR